MAAASGTAIDDIGFVSVPLVARVVASNQLEHFSRAMRGNGIGVAAPWVVVVRPDHDRA